MPSAVSLSNRAPLIGGAVRSSAPARAAVTAPASRDVFERPTGVLSRGSTGLAVRALQRKLVSTGYLSPDAAATGPGVFGPRTEDAVRSFQRRHGIKPSGVAGDLTQRTLDETIRKLSGADRALTEPAVPAVSAATNPVNAGTWRTRP
jgi:peptidoglycan hydrolase-like protein with peptidoglycan-binding domain